MVRTGDIAEAIDDYRQAIYGSWSGDVRAFRAKARLELIETLRKAGRPEEAQQELISLKSEMPEDTEVQKKVGRFFLEMGLPRYAAEVYQGLVKVNANDGTAYAGLGEAEAALGDLAAAQRAYGNALRTEPGNATWQDRLQGLGTKR